MQIDFHHAATYVIARLAGFGHREAETVAYCAQYVDDATNTGTIYFGSGAMYTRICSAHKMVDPRNFEKQANHHVWIPFHFLPGNGRKRAGENPQGSFIEKIICKPNSYIAQDMVRACIEDRDALYGLHRLGVTMHVFADTWAHQQFAGVTHRANNVRALDDQDNPDPGFLGKLIDLFEDKVDQVSGGFVQDVLPLGHGGALTYPDLPYLKWKYRDYKGEIVQRNNAEIFSEAADEMCKAMQRYRTGEAQADVPGLTQESRGKIKEQMEAFRDEDGEDRHRKWLDTIRAGDFGFPPVRLDYRAKGAGSWKHQAVGTRRVHDRKNDTLTYHPSFLSSDWKLFHDAVLAHRFTVIHNILPRYGICAA